MAVLFNITHDADNLDEYDSTVTDGGDLSTGTPGLADTTARMEALLDDTNAIYGQKNQGPPASDEIRYRFYVHPNTLTMGSGEHFGIIYSNGAGQFYLRYDGTNYEIRYAHYDDGGWASNNSVDVTDAEHYVEIHVERASGVAGNDGRVRWWIDGALQDTFNDVDNWDYFAGLTRFRMGATYDIDAGTSGTFYLDEFKANDDGSEIGPVVAAGQPMALRTFGIPTGAGARNRPGGWN